MPLHMMPPSPVLLVPRSDPSPSQTGDPNGNAPGNGSSFFTFLVALLILAFVSAALVLRAVFLRRRFRNRIQAAIDAGILPRPIVPDQKPELYEINVGEAKNPSDWQSLMPVCATALNETNDLGVKQTVCTSSFGPTPSILSRVSSLFRRQFQTTPVTDNTMHNNTFSTDNSTGTKVQVAVLIAMPAEFPTIPQPEPDVDSEGKPRDSLFHDESIPDVMFGISALSLVPIYRPRADDHMRS